MTVQNKFKRHSRKNESKTFDMLQNPLMSSGLLHTSSVFTHLAYDQHHAKQERQSTEVHPAHD